MIIIMEQKYIVPLEDVFSAYYDCRKHKRNKKGALLFEIDFETNLIQLWKDLQNGTYKISSSTVFIVDKPVKREIFAADFRDRIVHHLLLMYLNPYFEKHFIYDSYSCRAGKGTHFAIKRVNHFIQSCSENGKKKCWILKIDIQSFFMSISKNILYGKLINFIDKYYKQSNIDFVKYLCSLILWNNPVESCIFHSPKHKWRDLAYGKSLFTAKEGHGLPIGNFTSQVFANFYLSELDHFIKHTLGIKYYGRYVDDCVIVSESKQKLRKYIPKINSFLRDKLELNLQPKKIYIQNNYSGVRFLGCFIKHQHIISNRRTIKNFCDKLKMFNFIVDEHKPTKQERDSFISSVNSYLGFLIHYKTYRIRSNILNEQINPLWYKQISISGKSEKIERLKISRPNWKKGAKSK